MVNGIPSGSYKFDGRNLRRTHFKDADIFSTGGSWGKAHERYGEIASNNMIDLFNPTIAGDNDFHRRLIAMTIDASNESAEAMNSAYTDNFGIYNTDVVPLNGQTNPATNPANPSIGFSGGAGITPGGAAGGYPVGSAGVDPSGAVDGTNGLSGVDPTGTDVNPGDATNGLAGAAGSGNVDTNDIKASDSEDKQAVFNSRLALIEQYCEKYGKTVDVDKIRSEYSDKPEEGIKYCDDILNDKFDQDKLKRIVKNEYDSYNQARLDAGKQVSDQWVDAVIKGGLEKHNAGGGVTKDNVLDVVGTFMTNDEVKEGKVSLENVMEQPEVASQLIDALKEKADDFLLSEDVDDGLKKDISSQIENLRDTYDKYSDSISDKDKSNDMSFNQVRKQLADGYTKLFETLRMQQAKHNDEAAPQYYGLPEDSSIKLTSQTDEAKNEINSYKNRKRLNVSF